jgi:hypothetical protein
LQSHLKLRAFIVGMAVLVAQDQAVAQSKPSDECPSISDQLSQQQNRLRALNADFPVTLIWVCGSFKRADRVELKPGQNMSVLSLNYIGCVVISSTADCTYVIRELTDTMDRFVMLQKLATQSRCPAVAIPRPC